ncbi:TRAP-type C4-dicarboxylate transport system, small permease component [Paracoccus isoporae]|uniref:TRAP transporter small permease protein n=1 Tax=Paracoccus isoporae TaxID=591205 RepID=A0A1G6ZL80_9RHOB|nr:TRAP transporter small permease [Paracoccus isoporae]SDE03173.1 TRAP-type C4-dicarboxylate transport system, small permease component [Paracoccus isoporae]
MTDSGAGVETMAGQGARTQGMLRCADRIGDVLVVVSTACLAGIALLTVLDVILRNTVGVPVPGMIDITQLAMMYTVFPCIAYAFSRRAHVAVTVLSDMMPASVARVLAMLGWLAGAVVCGVLSVAVWGQARLIWAYGDVSQNMRIPMIFYWVPIVTGLALSVLAAASAIFAETGDPDPGGADR